MQVGKELPNQSASIHNFVLYNARHIRKLRRTLKIYSTGLLTTAHWGLSENGIE